MMYSLNVWICFVIFFHFSYLYGFLLDSNNPQQSSGGQNKQYLTLSEFIDERNHQQRQLQQEFTLLASQLSQKFAALEQKITETSVKNETFQANVQSQEIINELTKNYTDLQHDFEILHKKYIALNEELKLVRNKTYERDIEITSLMQLKTIQPLQDIHTLQKEVHSISMQTQALRLTQHARSEDLQSLYNETISSNRGIANLATELQNFQSNQSMTLADLHLTISSLDAKFQNKLQSSENSLNSSLADLHQLVDRNSERVALLSNHVLYGDVAAGSAVPFDKIQHSYGITHSTLSKFKSTGIFICEVEGLYLIATTIISRTSGSWVKLMKNQEELSRPYIAYHGSDSTWHSGTGIAVVTLQVKDTIYIEAGITISISNSENMLIIIKIK